MASSWSQRAFVGVTFVAGMGCAFAPVDLDGRTCPCAPGWTCGPRDVCLRMQADAEMRSDAAGSTDAWDGGTATPPDATVCPHWLCDDFEAGSAERVPPWSLSHCALPVTSTERAHTGRSSARFTIDGEGSRCSLAARLPAGAGDVSVRFWVWVPGSEAATNVSVIGITNEAQTQSYSLAANASNWAYWSTRDGRGGTVQAPARDAWTCVAFRVAVGDASTGHIDVNVGGSATVVPWAVAFEGGTGWVDLGLVYAGAGQGAFTYFVDDVAISTTGELSCPR